MYGSHRQGSRSWLGEMLGFDAMNVIRNPEAYGFDIERTESGYRVEIPVAGFRPDEINVTVEDRQLNVEGRSERRRFTRSVVLPEEIDPEKIDAHVEHGLLTLTLPLHAKMQPRRIEVRVAGSSGAGIAPSISGETGAADGRPLQERR